MSQGMATGPVMQSGAVMQGAGMASNAAGALTNGGSMVMGGNSMAGTRMAAGMGTGQVVTSSYAGGPMVGPGGIVGGAPMVGPGGAFGGAPVLGPGGTYSGGMVPGAGRGSAVVSGGGDACGCGPGASAGDCTGACGGMETMCCEPEGGLSSVQWVQVSGGSYRPVMSYQYVGEGSGTYEREVVTTHYGWRVRKCCLCLLGLLLLAGLLYLLSTMFGGDDDTESDQPNPVIIRTPAPTSAPELPAAKTCIVFGDPHVKTFDGQRSDYYTPGEYWIVRSRSVYIQGKYQPTRMTNGLSVTKEIGISGPFIKNHKLIISVEDVKWDNAVVMQGFANLGAKWHSVDPPISIDYNGQGKIMQKSREGKALHVVHVNLPLGVTMEINRWMEPGEGSYMNIRLTMPPQPDQDGHCGNANNNPADDTRVAVRARVGKFGVPEGQLIFPGPKTPINPGNRPDLNDCPAGALKVAMTKCRAAEGTTFPSKACLVDTCLGHLTPQR